MVLDFLKPLEVLSQLRVQLVAHELRGETVLRVALPVQEPLGNVVLSWPGKDVVDLLEFRFGQLAGALVEVHLRNLEHDV